MIAGLGLDLVEIGRLEAAMAKRGGAFEKRVFTEEEIQYCKNRARPSESFAARWAAKEAFFKALGGAQGAALREVEVVPGGEGPPKLALHGQARKNADACGVSGCHLSLTHTAQTAAAVVVLTGKAPHGFLGSFE